MSLEDADLITMKYEDFESLIYGLIGDCYVKVKNKSTIEIWQRYSCYGSIKYKKENKKKVIE